MPFYSDFRDILKVINKSIESGETVEIYYPKTENNPEGWREVKAEGLYTDIPPQGEKLVYGSDRLSPGHILAAFPLNSKEPRSFIVGKIKGVHRTGNKIKNKNGLT